MGELLLVRYGELALKSPPVRREFERTLRRNLIAHFLQHGVECRVRSDRGHLYVEVGDGARGLAIARRVFGVTSVSRTRELPTERPLIEAALLEMAGPVLRPGARFAVRARRTGQHDFTSQQLAGDLGGAVLDRWPELTLKVDLEHPEVELHVEVRGPKTYLYTGRVPGPGGLPLGVAGAVVALVDGTRGALGAYLMMKRGCRCAVVTEGPGLALAEGILRMLDPKAVIKVPDAAGPDPTSTLRALAEATRADGIVLPLTVDDFPAARAAWGDAVVFSPTVGLTDEEVEIRWNAVEELAS